MPLVELVHREGEDTELYNELYITSGGNPGWAGVATFGEHTNKEDGRRQWTFQDDGSLTLEDKRQLYANNKGWVGAALQDEEGTDNNDPSRRKWTQDDKGILTLEDGRQLYINHGGWAGVTRAGEDSNDDDKRKVWKIINDDNKIKITSIAWKQIGTIPAGRTTSKVITVGVTQMDSKKETKSTTFTNTFEVSANYAFPSGASAGVKNATSLAVSRILETMSSTTMTYQQKYTETWEVSDKDRKVWGLTMQGVLLADSLCGF